jgi:hypothetical protein
VLRFSNHPAMITVTEGIQDAFGFLGATWRMWLPVVGAVAGATFFLLVLIGPISTSYLYYVDSYSGAIHWYGNAGSQAGHLALYTLATLAVSLIAGWVISAVAISGLRNRPVTAAFVVSRGLYSFLASIVLAFAGVATSFVLVIVVVIVPPVGILLLLAAIPVIIYLSIRLIFVTLAIFDGFGPIEGIQESWRLSQQSVTRMFGWGLMAVLITLGFGILGGIASAPFTARGSEPVNEAISTAVGTVGSCFTVFMMAVLYESQRARMDPTLYGPTPMPFNPYGYPGMPPAGYGSPSAPPPAYGYAPPPPPPIGFSYPGSPAATPPGGMPGWISPNAPAWPPAPTAPSGWNSGQPSGWNSGQPSGWNSGQPSGWGAPQGWGPPPGWTPPGGPVAPSAATAWGASPADPPAPSSGPTPASGPAPDSGPAPEPPTSQEPPANS